jgi:uncharacterized damage-inducible protein DinB
MDFRRHFSVFWCFSYNPAMNDLTTIKALLRYSDWANEQLVRAAAELTPEQLDQGFDIGLGSLRRILLHILAGETVWLKRWQGDRETPWPNENEPATPADIGVRFSSNARHRDVFLNSISPAKTADRVTYRDSKGSLFSATLGDMMIQMCTHSTHHRAQAVNIFRRLSVTAPELDYMMWVRV